ncbi:MAG: hypothetical protein HY814_09355 [Candidatus Riflebacteria bacterium]|nr:hypothetical protein [Candidatus Riflebacteria bacterium]
MPTTRARLLLTLVLALTIPMTACSGSGSEVASSGDAEVASSDPSGETTAESQPSSQSATSTRSTGRKAAPGSPEATLEEYIRAELAGDWAAVSDCLTDRAQDDFNDATENMTEDDLVEAGLETQEGDYRLESADSSAAIFFSRRAALYLVMTREGGQWKIDPAATDKLNLEGE